MEQHAPCVCPRCGWLGTLHDMHELQTTPPQNICPRCTRETRVNKLGQKGLDGLRREYDLLVKMSYAKHLPPTEKFERRALLERFFEHINEPLRDKLT